MEWMLTVDNPGQVYLLQGNEAFARGALESGIRFAAAYPGSPSSEILGMLGRIAQDMNIYAEWSTNETCAFQACMGASMSGVRALCVAKQNGLLFMGDALHSGALSGCNGGVVLITADDPEAHSSTNEFDSRHQARSAGIPLLEPATYQEAKDMVKFGFDLSEQLKQIVIVRGVTRIHHGRGNVVLGDLPEKIKSPQTAIVPLMAVNWFHEAILSKLTNAQEIFETSEFNWYVGPDKPELLIVTSGIGWLYSEEIVKELALGDRVGILKLGCTWPLPEKLIMQYLKKTRRVLVIEEVDPFLEQNIGDLIAHNQGMNITITGRKKGQGLPWIGELTPDVVREALIKALDITVHPHINVNQVDESLVIPPRDMTFCAGCPHRASFYVLKQVKALLGAGLVMGDIGCYTLGGTGAGYYGLNALSCMGGGINMAEGLGQLSRFGFDQPIFAVAGDSTFFHSCLPGLVNAKFQNANMLFIVLDNSATAMTGFQPHPGTGLTCMGSVTEKIVIEDVVKAIGCPAVIADPFEVQKTVEVAYRLASEPGLKVLILRQQCATLAARSRKKPKIEVEIEKCLAENCGCNFYCSRVWGCPGNIVDYVSGKASIDEVVCIGCGVCAQLCPTGAIRVSGGE